MAFSEKIIETRQKALASCKEYFARPDEIAEFNTLKILDAMRKVKCLKHILIQHLDMLMMILVEIKLKN